jgi:hypothetical protein
VTVDGDIVPGVPGYGYKHVGTEVLIDGTDNSGSIIVGPSFVERRLRVQNKNSVAAHALEAYKRGLIAVADAALFLAQLANPEGTSSPEPQRRGDLDLFNAAVQAAGLIQEKEEETRKIRAAVQQLQPQPTGGSNLGFSFYSSTPVKPVSQLSLTSRVSKQSLSEQTPEVSETNKEVASSDGGTDFLK